MFEPTCDGGTTTRVATCGGKFLCVFDVTDGSLVMKYRHKSSRGSVELWAIAWTNIKSHAESHSILASGSNTGELQLYHPKNQVAFYKWKEYGDHQISSAVVSARWHNVNTHWLMVASDAANIIRGHVTVWDITVKIPNYSATSHTKILRVDSDNLYIYCMEWIPPSKWLLLGSKEGLTGWRLDKLEDKTTKKLPREVKFKLPGDEDHEDEINVDSLCSLGGDLVAVKCVTRGKIYVWGVGRGEESDRDAAHEVVRVNVLAVYNYWITTEFYLHIGANKKSGLFGCGDDRGNIWMYKRPATGDPGKTKERKTHRPEEREPVGRISWPLMRDRVLEEPVKAKGTLIDKVAISEDDKYIVAVTDKNTVVIWTKNPNQ